MEISEHKAFDMDDLGQSGKKPDTIEPGFAPVEEEPPSPSSNGGGRPFQPTARKQSVPGVPHTTYQSGEEHPPTPWVPQQQSKATDSEILRSLTGRFDKVDEDNSMILSKIGTLKGTDPAGTPSVCGRPYH